MKQIIRRVAALVVGLGLGAAALAGLESVTHISDLNASWPLGSDLASTSDDHIRNIKTALKTDFPNINAAVTATPAQLNTTLDLTASGSNLTASGTLTASSFIPSSSTVPTNGIYLPAANTLGFASNSTKWGSVNSTGNWVLVAPSSGSALAINGVASSNTLSVNAPTGAGTSFGEFLAGGTNSSDYALSVVSASGGTSFFKVRGDGAIQGGGPVAGALVDMTPDTGTFTGTLVGGTTSPTTTVRFYRIGKQVTVNIPKQTFTSNSTSFSMSGVPASLQPATSGDTLYAIGPMQDNSAEVETNFASVNSSGSINFFKNSSTASNWTNIGTKGIGGTGSTGIAFTYSLD